MKYKKLTKEQILTSADRLTRFKPTEEKYIRVFTDILISNLIEPKLKKKDINTVGYEQLSMYVSEIINGSLSVTFTDDYINNLLLKYENSVFNNNTDAQKLLKNTINYYEIIKLIPDNAPKNLLWLRELLNKNYSRNVSLLKYPLEKIILVEGITEEILLPEFANMLGYNFDAEGVQIIAAGGKNQVVKMYYKLSEEVKLPIFILLDRDAEDNIKQIKPKLRKSDTVHLVSCGEFEDLLPKNLIIKTVNQHFKNFLKISNSDLPVEMPTVKILEELFKKKGLHEFKKAEFAKLVKENIADKNDISDEIKEIVLELSKTNKSLDTKLCS